MVSKELAVLAGVLKSCPGSSSLVVGTQIVDINEGEGKLVLSFTKQPLPLEHDKEAQTG